MEQTIKTWVKIASVVVTGLLVWSGSFFVSQDEDDQYTFGDPEFRIDMQRAQADTTTDDEGPDAGPSAGDCGAPDDPSCIE